MTIPAANMLHYQIVIRGRQAAAGSSVAPAINVFCYRRTTLVAPASKANLNTIFQTTILVPLLAAANVRYTPNTVSIRCLNDAQDPYADFAAAGAGAIATDSEPSDDAVYCYLKTAIRMPGGKGGKHFAGTSEVDTTGDILTGAGLARWQAVQAALKLVLVDATPNTWVPTVFMPTSSQIKINPTTVNFADVIDSLLDLNIGTMRRRRTKTVR